ISQQAQREHELTQSAVHWRSLVENAPQFIYTVDRDGRLLFINHPSAGIRLEDLLGMSIYSFALADEVPKIRSAIDHVFRTGETACYEAQWYDGNRELHWYESHFGPLLENGVITAVIGLALDIDQRKESEQKLQTAWHELEERVRQRTDDLDRTNAALRKEIRQRADAERQLRAQKHLMELVLQSMSGGVIVADIAGKAIIVNPSLTRIFGIEAEQICGRDWRQLPGSFETEQRAPLAQDELP